ncbi:MAG: transcription elongation factor GreA [Alphaproteobacteria bacterium]|nr:transcription elongation factor GreA [Alphaproteobacteria bacterium]
MNKAFVNDDDEGQIDVLPDREIPPHPNLVTAEGLAQIERMQSDLSKQLTEAEEREDLNAQAHIARDLRYWTARRSNAELVPMPADKSKVAFGLRVTIERNDGREQTFRIVGLDEADPEKGTVSYVAPMAKALMGKGVGDVVHVGQGDAEIVAIS